MSLDVSKLKHVRQLGNGLIQAQCPACAEAGQDRRGEHLRLTPDGKFGCCVFSGDRQHRKRIYALAGDHQPKAIKVRTPKPKVGVSKPPNILGRLGRLFPPPPASEPSPQPTDPFNGTDGTLLLNLRACREKKYIYVQESGPPVPFIPPSPEAQKPERPNPAPSAPTPSSPYLLSDGTLVIPFASPQRFHWWKGGQSVRQTRLELELQKGNHNAVTL